MQPIHTVNPTILLLSSSVHQRGSSPPVYRDRKSHICIGSIAATLPPCWLSSRRCATVLLAGSTRRLASSAALRRDVTGFGCTVNTRLTTQLRFDILGVRQRSRRAGTWRRLAKPMAELGGRLYGSADPLAWLSGAGSRLLPATDPNLTKSRPNWHGGWRVPQQQKRYLHKINPSA